MMTGLFAAIAIAASVRAIAGDCPAPVTSAVAQAHPHAKTLACKAEKEDGRTVYEVKIKTADGKTLEMDVNPDGTILVTEERIAVGDVPAAVMSALRTAHADAKVSQAERLTSEDGEISYELTYKSGGHEHEMTVTQAGDVLRAGRPWPRARCARARETRREIGRIRRRSWRRTAASEAWRRPSRWSGDRAQDRDDQSDCSSSSKRSFRPAS
jgi:uncharacterized membrane protein YkoI